MGEADVDGRLECVCVLSCYCRCDFNLVHTHLVLRLGCLTLPVPPSQCHEVGGPVWQSKETIPVCVRMVRFGVRGSGVAIPSAWKHWFECVLEMRLHLCGGDEGSARESETSDCGYTGSSVKVWCTLCQQTSTGGDELGGHKEVLVACSTPCPSAFAQTSK